MEESTAPESAEQRIPEPPQQVTADDWVDPGPPAGVWVRAGAQFIDGIALFAAIFVAAFALSLVVKDEAALARAIQAIAVLLGCAYFTGLTGFAGQTLGKMAAGVRVVTKDGGAVGYGRALGRWAGYALSAVTFGLGFAGAAFNKRRRALHDVVAGTRVVYVPNVGKGRKAAMAALGVVFALSTALLSVMMAAQGDPRIRERLAQEGGAVGSLKSVRMLVALYKAEKGTAPKDLSELSALGDFTGLPELRLPDHEPSKESVAYAGVAAGDSLDPTKLSDSGKWGYVSEPSDPAFGTVFIDCTHVDSEGTAWFEY